jgi:heme O synthase-like polyprenyltransferase
VNSQNKIILWLAGINRKKLNIFIILFLFFAFIFISFELDNMIKIQLLPFLVLSILGVLSALSYAVQSSEDMKSTGMRLFVLMFVILSLVFILLLIQKILS